MKWGGVGEAALRELKNKTCTYMFSEIPSVSHAEARWEQGGKSHCMAERKEGCEVIKDWGKRTTGFPWRRGTGNLS